VLSLTASGTLVFSPQLKSLISADNHLTIEIYEVPAVSSLIHFLYTAHAGITDFVKKANWI